ncbi:MAG: hypothetical protein AAF572_10440 [Cyanobacteria bacterium P01_B01_bin.77]
MGVIIASVAGLEAAFQWKDKAAKLNMLSALSESIKIQVDSEWRKLIGGKIEENNEDEAHKILDMQDKALAKIYTQSAEIGVDITYDTEDLIVGDFKGLRRSYKA